MEKRLSVFMYPADNSGCAYYRVKMPAKYLSNYCQVNTLPDWAIEKPIPFENCLSKDYHKRIGTYKDHAEKNDLLIFQRVDKPELIALIMAIKRVLGKKVAIDIDDDVKSLPLSNPAYKNLYPTSAGRYYMLKALEVADFITVSTERLKKVYEKQNLNIEVIPNYFDFKVLKENKNNLMSDIFSVFKKDKDKIRIGWAGSPTHYADLLIIYPVIRKILEKYNNIEIIFMGMSDADYLHSLKSEFKDKVILIDWCPTDKYFDKLEKLKFDIAIAPLIVNDFNRAKSNIKWLEYSALKIPSILSKYTAYDKSVEHGKTGFLCDTQKEWFDCLESLILDENLRNTIRINAYNEVKENYDIDKKIVERYNIYKRKLQ